MTLSLFQIVIFLSVISCQSDFDIKSTSIDASKICAGTVIGGVTGTASCSGSAAQTYFYDELYVLAPRNDLSTIDMTDPTVLSNIVAGIVNRGSGVSTYGGIYSNNDFLNNFLSKYQAIPNAITDQDGRFGDNSEGVSKKHYLETIVGRPTADCGSSGTISQRIADCKTINGTKAFYDGSQYGQAGEGDWKLVTRLSSGEEVWRDERTKLLWSDKSANNYNWYRASGYARSTANSQADTGYDAQPGSGTDCLDNSSNPEVCQPAQPISVCAEVNASGSIIAGGADPTYDGTYDANPETAFKGNLSISDNVIWKLPTIDDWKLADLNGLRKVLPNTDDVDGSGTWYSFWSTTSFSFNKQYIWYYGGANGHYNYYQRHEGNYFHYVRCLGFAKDS